MTLDDNMDALKEADRQIARLWAKLDYRTALLAAIADEFRRTVKHADWVAAGSRGMSVPFHGDFAMAAQFPSVVSRMRWWVREFDKALKEEV
jgi:hypothetical protein